MLALAGCLGAGTLVGAQAPAGGAQSAPSGDAQKPAGSGGDANPFPGDTSSVPVLSDSATPAAPADGAADSGSSGSDSYASASRVTLAGDDVDPIRSPDDPVPDAVSDQPADSSSSLAGLAGLLPRPDEEEQGKKKKHHKESDSIDEPRPETAKEDLNVGSYYLDKKNWKAAQSRYQSAMVLDPENPEVYWGLAESAYHLGDYAAAKANYLKLLDYDPDGPHSKEARKAMKDPAVANAKDVTPQSAPQN
jgi:tetratricopeptide (TPR) repeat protein